MNSSCILTVWTLRALVEWLRPPVVEVHLFCILLQQGFIASPPGTATPLLARYLLIEIWLPGNKIQN